MEIETSYDNKYGSGDRREFIKVESNAPFTSLPLSSIIDGIKSRTNKFGDITYGGNISSLVFTFNINIKLDEITVFERDEGMYQNFLKNLNSIVINKDLVLSPNDFTTSKSGYRSKIIFKKNIRKVKKIEFVLTPQTNVNGLYLREVEFKNQLDREVKLLIRKDNQYGYYTESFHPLGTAYPTKEQFEQYGMKDLSMPEAGDIPVEYEMELINQTEEGKFFSYTFDLNGRHKNMKSIDGIIAE